MSFIMGCYKTSSTGAIRVNANFVDFRGRRMKKRECDARTALAQVR